MPLLNSMPEHRRHVFYAHVKPDSRITRKSKVGTMGSVVLKIYTGQIDKDLLSELKNAVTPICFETTFFIRAKDKRSI